MKKIVRKFWGVALVVMMLSSLFMVGAPVAAATPLTWNLDVFIPSFVPATVWTLFPGTDIVDFAVGADGMTVYAALKSATDNIILMKSTNGGGGWTDLTAAANNRVPATLDAIDFVAISPDNPDVMVVLDAGGLDTVIAAAASTDGGLNLYDMGTIQDSSANAVTAVYDLDVSPATSNNIYNVAIGATRGANLPMLMYYNFGASVGNWRDATVDFAPPPGSALDPPASSLLATADAFRAVEFAPDGSLITVSEDAGAAGNMRLHVVSLASERWDADLALTGYPVTIDTATGAAAVRAAAIGIGPDYSGSEQETQVTFIGASFTDAAVESGGIYRIDESGTIKLIRENLGINSIEYDGVTVVAGAYMDNNVFRITDPLAGSPSAAAARSMKRIGIDDTNGVTPDVTADMVIVHFAGETIFGAKRADASALSKSADLGNVWNDFTLMDSSNADIDDFYVSPDNTVKYVASNDWNGTEGEVNIFRVAGFSSQRVLCVDQRQSAGALNLIIRGIPTDPDVIYAYDENGSDIYQTSDGGVTRWSKKTTYPGGAISDLAVESSGIVYGATGQLVYKSTSSGSSWAAGVDTGINIFNLISLGEGKLVAGGVSTYVGWSSDSGATWAKNGAPIPGNNFLVAATGLAATDWVFAAPTAGAGNQVYRTNPAPGPPAEFKSMNLPGYLTAIGGATTATTQGLVLTNGILYVIGSEPAGTAGMYLYHTLAPGIPGSHPASLWGTENIYANWQTIQNTGAASVIKPVLRAAKTTTSIILYTSILFPPIVGVGGPTIFYFDDIVSPPTAAPTLIAPADNAMFKIVSTMLADAQLVNFTWNRAAPQITQYFLWISLDEAFTQPYPAPTYPVAVASTAPTDIVSIPGLRGTFDPGLTYYWRVSASLPFNGGFSEIRSFTIEPSVATVPEILSPINGATVNTVSPAFSWSAITNATEYEFQLSELPGFETTLFTDKTSSAGEALPVTIKLERGKTYFWRVRASAPTTGDWSPVSNFMIAELTTTAPPPPTTQTTITIPPPPAGTTTIITVPPPPPEEVIGPVYIWAIIIIGAILVIAVIVLIVRTRRSV